MKYFIDTEFNEWGGELISLALIREDNESIYITYKMKDEPGPWVKEHVMPILWSIPSPLPGMAYKDLTHIEAAMVIANFLNYSAEVPHIIADWPSDIQYLCQALIVGSGQTVNIRQYTMEVNRDLNYNSTEVPGAIAHNAWWDAKCIKKVYEDMYGK